MAIVMGVGGLAIGMVGALAPVPGGFSSFVCMHFSATVLQSRNPLPVQSKSTTGTVLQHCTATTVLYQSLPVIPIRMSAEVSIPGFGHSGNTSVPVQCAYRYSSAGIPLNPMWYTLHGPGWFSCAASEAAALSPAHLALCTPQSAFWQAAPQYDATAHTEHFFSGTPVAPQNQQGFWFLTLRGCALAGCC